MQLREKLKNEQTWIYAEGALFAGFFLVAFFLCGQISYSDGDDTYFYQMAHSMPILDYLKMRYVEWEGRMTSEAMTYIAFHLGKSFWQPVNALILTLLPYGIIRMVKRTVGAFTVRGSFFLSLCVYMGILAMGIEVIGYGAFWITGSTFYLWSIVAGVWAAMPFVDLVFARNENSLEKLPQTKTGTEAEQSVAARSGSSTFLYALPCAFIAAMGQEQIAAVVIVFGVLAILYHLTRRRQEDEREASFVIWKRKIPWLHMLEVILMIAALIILLISPGTSARSQAEIALWMPQYDTMSVGNHIFITLQWVLSSFANEGKMLFFLVWIVGIWLLWKDRKQKHGKNGRHWILMGFCIVFAAAALLPYVGIRFFSELGMGVTDITQCVPQVATPASLSPQNWIAFVWWLAAVVFTLVLLWQLEQRIKEKALAVLLVLAACASEAIMYFSPTMYASGARVFFVAQVLLWLVLARLCGKLLVKTQAVSVSGQNELAEHGNGWQLAVLIAIAGVLNFVSGIPTLLSYL